MATDEPLMSSPNEHPCGMMDYLTPEVKMCFSDFDRILATVLKSFGKAFAGRTDKVSSCYGGMSTWLSFLLHARIMENEIDGYLNQPLGIQYFHSALYSLHTTQFPFCCSSASVLFYRFHCLLRQNFV